MKPYVYIFIRQDLTNSQRVVQSSHVAWELARTHNLETHPSIVLIGLKDLNKLTQEQDRIARFGFKVVTFQDSLWSDQTTAFGVVVQTEEDRKVFKRYQLLTDISFYPEFLQEQIKKQNCLHKKTKPAYYESLKFEYTPGRECCFCKKTAPGELTDTEKVNLYVNWYTDLMDGTKPLAEDIEKNKHGFNT